MRICVLLDSEAKQLEHHGIEHRCTSGSHHHYSRRRAQELVDKGEAAWVGRHKRRIKFLAAASWAKEYQRNGAGETLYCTMQLVADRAALLLTPTRRESNGRAGRVKQIAVSALVGAR